MPEDKKVSVSLMSEEDRKVLMKAYDKDHNNILSADEISSIVSDFNQGRVSNRSVLDVLNRYDTNKDGQFDADERLDMVCQLQEKLHVTLMTTEDKSVLMKAYDKDKNNVLSADEIMRIVSDFNGKKVTDPAVLAVLNKYDTNHDGKFDAEEKLNLESELHLGDTAARYGAYSGAAARIFRYLAFTSDFGEALRPVIKAAVVQGSYAVSVGYCVADIGYEAYKLRDRGYLNENGQPMSMTQCVVERTVFQGVASLAVPFAVIHSAVGLSRRAFTRVGRFTKWGPSVVGLSIIPLLPMYLDHPVEHAVDWTFQRFGPWAPGVVKPRENKRENM